MVMLACAQLGRHGNNRNAWHGAWRGPSEQDMSRGEALAVLGIIMERWTPRKKSVQGPPTGLPRKVVEGQQEPRMLRKVYLNTLRTLILMAPRCFGAFLLLLLSTLLNFPYITSHSPYAYPMRKVWCFPHFTDKEAVSLDACLLKERTRI